jgi:hypothetical protein
LNPIDSAFVQAHAAAFEDFWNRQHGDSFFELNYPAYGYHVHFTTNAREILGGAQLAAARYPHSHALDGNPSIELKIFVVPTWDAPPVPTHLPAIIQTVAVDDFMFQAATPWLQCFADVQARTMYAFVALSLANEPRIVSRYLLDRATNNILLREGVGQLHATSLVGDDHALIFIAPHGTGKSTTAFHLLNAGYRLLGDGILFIRERENQFELMGYPIGEAKLTPEMQALLPQWGGAGDEVTVHNIRKSVVNLRELAPQKMVEDAVYPKRIILCLAERNGAPATHAERLTPEIALERVLPDTLHWDNVNAMTSSLNVLRRVIDRAECYRLALGTNRQELVETVLELVNQ